MKKSEAVSLIKDAVDNFGGRSTHELAQEIFRVLDEVIRVRPPIEVDFKSQLAASYNQWEEENGLD
jgi:hypothetical protein